MRHAVLLAIALYQRYLSPYKGYRCAYSAHTGCASCSALGYRAIRRFGLFTGIGILRDRLQRCGVAYRRFFRDTAFRVRERGIIDCTPSPDACIPNPGEVAMQSVCDAPCACVDYMAKKEKEEAEQKLKDEQTHIPPAATPRIL